MQMKNDDNISTNMIEDERGNKVRILFHMNKRAAETTVANKWNLNEKLNLHPPSMNI